MSASRVRVLHVISGDLWAGAEVQAYTLINHLRRLPGVEVAAIVLNPGVLSDKLGKLGIEIEIVDERHLRPMHIVRRLGQFARRWHPNVVHTHRDKENVLGLLANRLVENVPAVRTVHGADEHSGRSGWRGIRRSVITGLDRWASLASGQTIIAVSEALGRDLQRVYPAERIVVIQNGVDVDGIQAQIGWVEYRTAEPEAIHVGIVGRLVPVKRINLFLQTAALLIQADRERQWRFHIIGDGPLRESLEADAARLQISSIVSFHGHRDDIASCLAGLDVLVICSDHEGMPMTALEAAAVSVPTVAHAVGGLVEVIPREFLVTRHGAQGYCDAVLRALRPDARLITDAWARQTRVRYSATRNVALTRALYGRLLERRGIM